MTHGAEEVHPTAHGHDRLGDVSRTLRAARCP